MFHKAPFFLLSVGFLRRNESSATRAQRRNCRSGSHASRLFPAPKAKALVGSSLTDDYQNAGHFVDYSAMLWERKLSTFSVPAAQMAGAIRLNEDTSRRFRSGPPNYWITP